MSDGAEIELYKQSVAAQDKYVYFMLAAAGACIAFAVTKTQDATLASQHCIVAGAVLSWGASFYAGIMHLRYAAAIFHANFELLKVEAGKHPDVGTNINFARIAHGAIKDNIKTLNRRSNLAVNIQLYLLLIGAAFYLTWHIIEMYLRIKP